MMLELFFLVLLVEFLFICYKYPLEMRIFFRRIKDFNAEMLGEKPTCKQLVNMLK
jgi:hypothetical protein